MLRALPFLACMALTALAGCQPKIGDRCKISTDCSLRGERTCDLSYRVDGSGFQTPNGWGECIIEGCARGNCPKEAACIKVYSTEFFSVACNPDREDVATVCEGDDCGPDCLEGTCPPEDNCDANEICLPEGVCATEVGARTSCRFECKKNSDCRNGYRCDRTGYDGVYAAPDPKDPRNSSQTKICVPDL